MKRIVFARRQFLRGAQGITVGLPFLPSLVPMPAYAAEAALARQPFFIAITTQHGGVQESAMYPTDATLSEKNALYSGHEIRRGTLTGTQQGTDTALSTVLRAPATVLTPKLVSKMSVLRGLDIPLGIAHHTGGYLGNYARNDGNESDGQKIQGQHMPTVDQLMAWSPSFYKSLTGVKERSLVIDQLHARVSWGFSSPASRSGTVQGYRTAGSASELFQKALMGVSASGGATTPAPQPPMGPSLVDRVMENYRSLRQSNRRLSSADKQRLDDHVEGLAELQRKIGTNVGTPITGACSPKSPATAADYAAGAMASLDVIAMAFACGTSRVGVVAIHDPSFANDDDAHYHQEIAHKHDAAGPQMTVQATNRRQFSDLLVRTAAKLDAIELSPGRTLLDDSLMMWTNEAGSVTHSGRSVPVIMAGGAAGRLKTGQYVDYRNLAGGGRNGLMYNQLLATTLQAMGLPASEWQSIQHNGSSGYGHNFVSPSYSSSWVSGVRENASKMLPFLAA